MFVLYGNRGLWRENNIRTLWPKISSPSASNMPNSVWISWISTKCCTLHYLNISYGHTHYDVCTLPCVLSVTSSCRQSLFTLSLHLIHWFDKGIKQQHTLLRLTTCIEATSDQSSNCKDKFRMIVSTTASDFIFKNLSGINNFTLTNL